MNSVSDKLKDEAVRVRSPLLCKALLLQFKKPQVYDLSIPDSYNIYSLVVLSTDVLSGKKIPKRRVNCLACNHDGSPLTLEALKGVLDDKEAAEELFLAVYGHRTEYSILEMVMSNYAKFRHEWFPGRGDWYEFRTGEREKAQEAVQALPKSFLESVAKIGDAFQKYIGLTNSPARIGKH